MVNDVPASDRPPPSPCIGICLIDPANGRCRGCLRYIEEIAAWYDASAAEKRAIRARIAERRRVEPGEATEKRE
ncbi:MAG TPA: DUF1289 domain-containing protein [Stellaceae bacterium]|nr:DUF1289 domain-containing protein [Stellaceae bacterium]